MEEKTGSAISDFISLSEAASLSGLSIAHIRRLVDTNKIWGVKIGRNWVTTKQKILEYTSQPHPRGRKPKKLD